MDHLLIVWKHAFSLSLVADYYYYLKENFLYLIHDNNNDNELTNKTETKFKIHRSQ